MRILSTSREVLHKIEITDKEARWLEKVANETWHDAPDYQRGILSQDDQCSLILTLRELIRES